MVATIVAHQRSLLRAAHRTRMLRYMGATVRQQLLYCEASRKLAYGMAMVRLSYHIYRISTAPYGHIWYDGFRQLFDHSNTHLSTLKAKPVIFEDTIYVRGLYIGIVIRLCTPSPPSIVLVL